MRLRKPPRSSVCDRSYRYLLMLSSSTNLRACDTLTNVAHRLATTSLGLRLLRISSIVATQASANVGGFFMFVLGENGRQLASRFDVEVRHRAQAHGGNSSAISSPTVTGFTGRVRSRIVSGGAIDAAVAGGGGDVGRDDGVVGAGAGEGCVDGPLICGVGACGINCEPLEPPGDRQSMG